MIAQGVLNLFSHPGFDFQSNPVVTGGVASNLIPTVLQQLVHKTNDTADGHFSLEGILGHLTDGQGLLGVQGQDVGGAGAVMDKLKGLFGKKDPGPGNDEGLRKRNRGPVNVHPTLKWN